MTDSAALYFALHSAPLNRCTKLAVQVVAAAGRLASAGSCALHEGGRGGGAGGTGCTAVGSWSHRANGCGRSTVPRPYPSSGTSERAPGMCGHFTNHAMRSTLGVLISAANKRLCGCGRHLNQQPKPGPEVCPELRSGPAALDPVAGLATLPGQLGGSILDVHHKILRQHLTGRHPLETVRRTRPARSNQQARCSKCLHRYVRVVYPKPALPPALEIFEGHSKP